MMVVRPRDRASAPRSEDRGAPQSVNPLARAGSGVVTAIPVPTSSQHVVGGTAARRASRLCEGSHMMHRSDRPFFGLIMGGMVGLLALVGLLTVLHQFIPA